MRKTLLFIAAVSVIVLATSCLASPNASEETLWELRLVSVRDTDSYVNKLDFTHPTKTAPAGKIYKEVTVNCKNITEKAQTLSMSWNGIKLFKDKGAVGISEIYSGGLSNYCTVAAGGSADVSFLFEVSEGLKLTRDSFIQVIGMPGEKTLTLVVSE